MFSFTLKLRINSLQNKTFLLVLINFETQEVKKN